MAGVPGSVTRITHCDCVRISLILTPPLPMTEPMKGHRQYAPRISKTLNKLTRANQVVRDPELLSGRVRSKTGRGVLDRRSRLSTTLVVHGILHTRSILILEKNRADVVDCDMYSICHSHHRQYSLKRD